VASTGPGSLASRSGAGDVLEDGGSRSKHSENSNRNAVYGYGRWLTWLDRHGLLEATNSPADRIIPARVKAYIDDLEQHNATQTLLNRLQELQAVAVVMDPDRDWHARRSGKISGPVP
jgi:hypothetical protein